MSVIPGQTWNKETRLYRFFNANWWGQKVRSYLKIKGGNLIPVISGRGNPGWNRPFWKRKHQGETESGGSNHTKRGTG